MFKQFGYRKWQHVNLIPFLQRKNSTKSKKETPHTCDLNECYQMVHTLTNQAGNLIRGRISQSKTIETKSGNIDLVTETDKEVEHLFISNLKKKFPTHVFIGEESTGTSENKRHTLTEAPTWIIDPVDGTMNFVHSFPHCCISIALYVKCTPKIGIIYNPVVDQLFTARENHGAFLNGRPVKVSGQKDVAKALVMVENGSNRDGDQMKVHYKNINYLVRSTHGIRSLGSAALDMAMVAMGAADIYHQVGIHVWDIAAGALIVREAGGVVIDPAGGPLDILSRRILCASTQELAICMTKELTQFYPTPKD